MLYLSCWYVSFQAFVLENSHLLSVDLKNLQPSTGSCGQSHSVCTLGSSEMLNHVTMRVEGRTAAADQKYIFRTFPRAENVMRH